MFAEMIALRLVHIVGGIFWVGGVIFTTLYLMPALASAGPAAGPVMAALQKTKLFVVMPISAILTVLAGLRLLWLASGGFQPFYFSSGMGRTFAIGGGAAIVAFFLGLIVTRPAAMKVGQLGAQMAQTTDPAKRAEIQAQLAKVQPRAIVSGKIVLGLLLIAIMAMAVARYMG